jgi:hypothetical protein
MKLFLHGFCDKSCTHAHKLTKEEEINFDNFVALVMKAVAPLNWIFIWGRGLNLQASKFLHPDIQYCCNKPTIDRPKKLPIDKDPSPIQSQEPNHQTQPTTSTSPKLLMATTPVDHTLFNGEFQIYIS